MKRHDRHDTARHDDAGFATLTLVISTIAMVAVLLSTLGAIWAADNVQMTTSGMTAAGSTSQVTSQQFSTDVQGATSLSENAAAVNCGVGTLVLGMKEATGTIAYSEQTSGSTTQLVRTVCSSNFFPATSLSSGAWQSAPGNCHNWDPSQAALTAAMQSNAYDGFPAMAISGSYGNGCETQGITMPTRLVGGDTFTVSLAAQTQGPLSSGPSLCIWDSQASECLPNTWSALPSNVSAWTAFNVTCALPSAYASGDSLTLFLYSGETDGGAPAVNAYADIQMTTGGSTTVAQNVTSAVALPVTTGTTTTTALQAGWVNATAVGYVTIGLTITGEQHTVLLTGAPEVGGAQ